MKEKPSLTNRRMDDWNWTDGRDELFGLDDMCKKYINENSNVLEIGSNNGVSTSLFAYYAKSVVSVDVNCSSRLMDVTNKYGNIVIKTGMSVDEIPLLEDHYFDLIYIDADHSYKSVCQDIAVSIKKLKKGGILSGHDYCGVYHPQVFQAIQDHLRIGIFNILEVYKDTSWNVRIDESFDAYLDEGKNPVIKRK